MPAWEGKRLIQVVSACMNANGCPDFVLNQVEVTHEELENDVHYDLAEAGLRDAGFDEPFVHFDSGEDPAFLHPAVRQYLGLPPTAAEPTPSLSRRTAHAPRH
jgi:hypothetical protein